MILTPDFSRCQCGTNCTHGILLQRYERSMERISHVSTPRTRESFDCIAVCSHRLHKVVSMSKPPRPDQIRGEIPKGAVVGVRRPNGVKFTAESASGKLVCQTDWCLPFKMRLKVFIPLTSVHSDSCHGASRSLNQSATDSNVLLRRIHFVTLTLALPTH